MYDIHSSRLSSERERWRTRKYYIKKELCQVDWILLITSVATLVSFLILVYERTKDRKILVLALTFTIIFGILGYFYYGKQKTIYDLSHQISSLQKEVAALANTAPDMSDRLKEIQELLASRELEVTPAEIAVANCHSGLHPEKINGKIVCVDEWGMEPTVFYYVEPVTPSQSKPLPQHPRSPIVLLSAIFTSSLGIFLVWFVWRNKRKRAAANK
jgi:hypothetical protein